jgi:hypothetical protein
MEKVAGSNPAGPTFIFIIDERPFLAQLFPKKVQKHPAGPNFSNTMKLYKIGKKEIEFDPAKEYLDFYIEKGKQQLVSINLEALLTSVESGTTPIDDNLQQYMLYLQRWVTDAPRKKQYRQMRKDGFTVISGEQFFDEEGGDKIINDLENTGKFAEYFLKQVYNK